MNQRIRYCSSRWWRGLALVVSLVFVAACQSAAPTEPEAPPAEAPSGKAVAEEGAEDFNNTIKWSTASELDNFGYDIYRSESDDGPFERINAEVVEGAGSTDEVTRYRYVDDTIDPRRTYYYYIESISMAGARERFTPIAKSPPKIPPEEQGKDDGH